LPRVVQVSLLATTCILQGPFTHSNLSKQQVEATAGNLLPLRWSCCFQHVAGVNGPLVELDD